jgi:hypothetical protein
VNCELPALPAVYSGIRQLRRAKSAAISFNNPHIVNLFSRQTLPTRRGIQWTSLSVTMFSTGLSQFLNGRGHPKDFFLQSFGWR